MINITYHRNLNRLTMTGHAGSDSVGHDLVCASASILAHTLAANVRNLEKSGAAWCVVADIKEGYAEIGCGAPPSYRNIVAHTFQSVIVGFEILANEFPEYISYTIIG